MSKNAPIPIRLDEQMNKKVTRAAKKLGIPRSTLIRMLIESFANQFEANGDRITMPPEWKGARPNKK